MGAAQVFEEVAQMQRLDSFLTVTEAAGFLGVSPNTVRNWGRQSKIPEFRHPVNNYRLYRKEDLIQVLRKIPPRRTKRRGPIGRPPKQSK
jgi:MerR family copper efflux transcriptional regulator